MDVFLNFNLYSQKQTLLKLIQILPNKIISQQLFKSNYNIIILILKMSFISIFILEVFILIFELMSSAPQFIFALIII